MQLEDYSEFVWNNFYQVLLELRDKKRIYIRGVWNEENKDSTKVNYKKRIIYRYKKSRYKRLFANKTIDNLFHWVKILKQISSFFIFIWPDNKNITQIYCNYKNYLYICNVLQLLLHTN